MGYVMILCLQKSADGHCYDTLSTKNAVGDVMIHCLNKNAVVLCYDKLSTQECSWAIL
jgi:hypothetical protein